jgi:tetratricopeptide (TPR) repeat protein
MNESMRLQEIRKMLLTEPQDEFLNYALALELEKDGKPNLAIEILEKILIFNEEYSGAYYKLGALFAQTGQKEKALAVYQKGIEITTKQKNDKKRRELREALQNLEED